MKRKIKMILNEKYKHYKNQEIYIPINFCKIQENDLWIEAVIYKTTTNELFVRSKKEFMAKFTKA